MLLTKDNLLRFVRKQKYVIPADVSSEFETSTMIASAALSELAKEGSVKITHLKLSSSPYYYDKLQKESIQELAQKHFSSHDLNLYKKIKESQIINLNSLPPAEKISVQKVRDFAVPLEIEHQGKKLEFLVWYLRDIDETKKQIIDFLDGKESSSTKKAPEEIKEEVKAIQKEVKEEVKPQKVESKPEPKKTPETPKPKPFQETNTSTPNHIVPEYSSPEMGIEKDKVEEFIEKYLVSNYLKVEEKDKLDNGYFYSAKLKINKITLQFDCRYFSKKPQEADIIKFYTSSMNPKIVFIENAPKKLFKLTENLDNLELVNI